VNSPNGRLAIGLCLRQVQRPLAVIVSARMEQHCRAPGMPNSLGSFCLRKRYGGWKAESPALAFVCRGERALLAGKILHKGRDVGAPDISRKDSLRLFS